MVETTHPEVIAAAVTEQPQVITESDVAVAREVAEQAEPVVEPQEETADIEEVVETAEVVVAEPEVVAQPAAPVVAEVAAEVETVAAVEPEVTVEHNHATAPMTRARHRNMFRRHRVTVTGSALLLPSKVKVPQVVIRQHIMPLPLLRVRNLLSNN